MLYTVDEGQLLRLWSVVSYFENIQQIEDPVVQFEILTNAQILLTAFILDLQPLSDETKPWRTGVDRGMTFDA
jgi:hypothetical protein